MTLHQFAISVTTNTVHTCIWHRYMPKVFHFGVFARRVS